MTEVRKSVTMLLRSFKLSFAEFCHGL